MISREKKIALYSAMVKYHALAAQSNEALPFAWKLSPGLEATVAAVTADLKRSDSFTTTGSRLASSFIRGAKLKNLLASLDVKSPHAGNGHLPSSALVRQFASAVEAAQTLSASKGNAISVLFCESRVNAGMWRKQLQRASRNNLPLVFVRFAPEPVADRKAHTAPEAFVFGVPRIAVDSSDVLAVYRVASEAVARARHRRGPTLIDCVDFAHHDADPIHSMELHLSEKRILSAPLKQKIARQIQREVNTALRQIVN